MDATSPPASAAPTPPPGQEPRASCCIASYDWGSSPLGPQSGWPQSLRFAASICVHSGLPAAIYWGEDHLLVYNDHWCEALIDEPALGRPAAAVRGSLWTIVGPLVEQVARTGEGAFLREQRFVRARDGIEEESYWNVSLLPLVGDDGKVAGVLNQANDVTKTVLAERRLSFQISLADRLRGLSDPEDVKRAATQLLGEYLGAARVGYAEIDEAEGTVSVRSEWTRDERVASLAGQSGAVATFGPDAMAFLRSGEVIAIGDIRALSGESPDGASPWEALGVRALITVPLLLNEGAIKALLYVHDPEPRSWKRSEAAMARDVAERTWAAVQRTQAEQSLRESEDHYRHTVELNPQVTWTARPDGQLNRVSGRWEGWTGSSGLGDGWAAGIHPDDRPSSLEAWRRSIVTGEPYDVEHRVRHLGGNYRWARSRAYPRHNSDGSICLWYGSTEDIHERKVAEEHQRLLINELNHRVKNSLATVQAIAFQTLKGDIPLAEARGRFEARLIALSRAHNVLTEQNWGRAALDRVVRDATEHLADRDRFAIEGGPLWLTPRAALALAMALHELGTNAAKYGALSCETGRVAIEWSFEGPLFALEWKESGGPPVAEPARRGFGSRLIEKGLQADLGGTTRLLFEPDGLRCRIEGALDTLQAGGTGLD